MYAIVEIKGKQFKVREEDTLYVPLLKDAKPDDSVTIENVLLVSGDDRIDIGRPVVEGATVTATVLGNVKADKVVVFKKKRRKRYRVKRGHRQEYTRIRISSVSMGEEKATIEA